MLSPAWAVLSRQPWSQCSASIVQTVKPIPKKTEKPQKPAEAPVEAEQEPEQEQGNMKLLAPPMIKPFHISLKDTDGKRKWCYYFDLFPKGAFQQRS